MLGLILAANVHSTPVDVNAKWHEEAETLLVQCMQDSGLKSKVWEIDLDKAKIAYEEVPLSDADSLNGYKYHAVIHLKFPYKDVINGGTDWQMQEDYQATVYYKTNHMWINDYTGPTLGANVLFSSQNCNEVRYHPELKTNK